MKFKVGDKVKVIKCKSHLHCENINKISKIEEIQTLFSYPYSLEDCDELFNDEELELVEKQFTKADLKDGDKCTLKNGQVVFFNKDKEYQSFNYGLNNLDKEFRYYYNDNVSIVKVERPVKYETMFERKEEILDETEKRYLASVIRPFRNEVKNIVKIKEFFMKGKEFLRIELKNDDCADFPYFEKGTMYKGMKEDKEYTLKELGL